MADLWEVAEGDAELGNAESVQLESGSTVLLVGDSGCGKSSLIQAFLKPNSTKDPKPTFALDYNFARRKNAGQQDAAKNSGAGGRTVAHLWELGGDVYEPKLLDIPLSLKNITSSSVVIVCDMSKPKNVFASLKRWVSLVRDVVQRRVKALSESGPEGAAAAAALKDAAIQSYGSTHVDSTRVRPCEVPLVILGNKYDTFKSVASADRRTLLQVMRFVAHQHGATLLLTSAFEREAYRALFNSVCFGLPVRPALELALDRPLCVTAGRDDFSAILLGTVPASGGGGNNAAADEPATAAAAKSRLAYSEADVAAYVSAHGVTRESWGRFAEVLQQAFGPPDPDPPVAGSQTAAGAGPGEEGKDDGADGGAGAGAGAGYPEAEVDEARAQRDAALQRYVDEAARREALGARAAAAGSGAGAGLGGGGGGGEAEESKESGGGGRRAPRDEPVEEGKSSGSRSRSSRK